MKSILKFTFIIFIFFTFSFLSCNKTGLQNEYLLTDEMKGQNPFFGGEKLYYLSDSLNHVVFNVSARNNKLHEVPYGQRTNIWDIYEVEQTSFQSEQNSYIHFDMHYNAGYYFWVILTYKNKGRQLIFDLPMNKENSGFIDSLLVQEKWYYNIFTSAKDTSALKLFYSTEYGIIKVEFSDGSYLELEKIKDK